MQGGGGGGGEEKKQKRTREEKTAVILLSHLQFEHPPSENLKIKLSIFIENQHIIATVHIYAV